MLSLALGIGANTTIFSVVHAVLIRPLPYPDADALVGIYNRVTVSGQRSRFVTDICVGARAPLRIELISDHTDLLAIGHSRASGGSRRSDARSIATARANIRASRARHSKPYASRMDGGSDPIVRI